MQMKIMLSFSFIFLIIILFSIDPNTSLVADKVYKLNYRDVIVTDDKVNKDKGSNNKAHNDKHLCLQCTSPYLTFQPIKVDKERGGEGRGEQVVQSIKCQDCGFQWKEIWTLHNWFWLKSSSWLSSSSSYLH
jgi:hypothetical protein